MFLMLMVFWLIFNGRITSEILLVGMVVCGGLTYMWHKVFHKKHNVMFLKRKQIWTYLRYIGNLIVEIVRCNIRVMRLILHPQEEIHPQLVTFRTRVKNESHRVILANSITLTPGTITVGMKDDLIRVHGLDESFTAGIEEWEMARRLEEMEEETEYV